MAAIFAFTCGTCGDLHEGSPSFGFDSPDQYACLSGEQKERLGILGSDQCVITHDNGRDYFIRAILEVPIHGVEEPFTWGVWVSLSKRSFVRYDETYENPVKGDGFFGWLCNQLPYYANTGLISADVWVRSGGLRPLLKLHRSDEGEHPLVVDHWEGISVAKAQEIAERLNHAV